MRSYISGGWLVGVPDVIFYKHAVEAVIAAPKPTRLNHPPRSVRDNLPDTKAVVFEVPRNPIFTRAHARRGRSRPSLLRWLRFRVGSRRRFLRRFAGRAHWLRSGRHRLFQRYDSISSNGRSDLSHGCPPLVDGQEKVFHLSRTSV